MKFKIGFAGDYCDKPQGDEPCPVVSPPTAARRSVVQVVFPGRGSSLAYYNDRFDLKEGDFVYVDGKLEGKRGRVISVNYNFKIKLSDYKRVIAQVNTEVKGRFHYAGSHFVTFDRNVIPFRKVANWFKAPPGEDEEVISGSDDTAFRLDNLKEMNITPAAAERGHDYYMENKVVYLSVDGTHGYAIAEGSEAYEIEFEYCRGEISHLTCSCFCSYNCKHMFAAMLELKEMLERIEKNYRAEYEHSDYFAAIYKGTLFSFAVSGKDVGSFVLE